ncbi:MAG TPA: HAD family hydrolase [Terriglobales bacterium]|nr:HAD family hydrolase [Terriglobales bacterium]
MKRAAFLDRDGVINRKAREGKYVTRWEEMQILPGVSDAIALLNRAGFRVIVVSNQRCVAKGLITTADLEALHRRLCEALARDGATIDAIYYCPHETQPPCRCRKPQPGMLLDAARDHDIDLGASWMIGDSKADVEAGKSAGCNTALLAGGERGAKEEAGTVAASLLEAVQRILQLEEVVAARDPHAKTRVRI